MLAYLIPLGYIIAGVLGHAGHHHSPFISKRSASTWNSQCNNSPRSECCTNIAAETWCEKASSRAFCSEVNEVGREAQCSPTSCPAGQTCYLTVPCKAHYQIGCSATDPCLAFPCANDGTCINTGINTFDCNCKPGYDSSSNCITDIDECASSPCQNGATCHDFLNSYTCSCVPGYTGGNCQTDINECMSDPCINGGSCNDLVNHFTCDCTDRFNGTVCEQDCRPGPVDILFVIDVSSSSKNNCRKIFNFMRSIVTQLPIGPDDFQIALVTYSSRPFLSWKFTTYATNVTLLAAIADLDCEGGATYTGDALQLAKEVFISQQYGARNGSAYKQIILMTDGMSSDRANAIKQSWALTVNHIKLYVVGVGHYVDHLELQSLAHSPDYVFSTLDHDVLQRLYLETAHPDCNDCKERLTSDIILLLDTSSINNAKYSTKAAISLIKYIGINNRDIKVGVISYSEDVATEIQLGSYSENYVMASITSVFIRNSPFANVTHALGTANENLTLNGRKHSKHFLIVFTAGKFENENVLADTINSLSDDVSVMIVGIGDNVNHPAIRDVVSDSYNAILLANADDFRPLQTVKSEISYTECPNAIFSIRH